MAISETEIAAYIASARQSPRLTHMLGEFSDLATGRKGAPDFPIILDPELLRHDGLSLEYAKVRERHAGTFNQHFIASLPYVLEEQCRFGAALLRYGRRIGETQQRPLDVYTLGDASGVTARSLTDISQGKIRTLTCSPNQENEAAFHQGRPVGCAHFFLGPFFEVSATSLSERGIEDFRDGFDFIIEDTTFQMYGKSRLAPIQIAAQNLRSDGIFVLLEKFWLPDVEEFARRERQKDDEFKARFFSHEKIEEKRQTIVHNMDRQLVTLAELTDAIGQIFSTAVIIWNSGNFYTIAASNDAGNLLDFVNCLTPSATPPEFQYAELPQVLLGDRDLPFAFREPSPTVE